MTLCVAAMVLLLAACGESNKKGLCQVEVFSPVKEYSEVALLDGKGHVIDSTLVVKNDSIIFSRTDTVNMPYVVTLRLKNPNEKLDAVLMPIVIEAGTVKVELAEDRLGLSGTSDNDALYNFVKARLKFINHYDESNPEHNVDKLKEDYSKFYSNQAIMNKDNIVGKYIFEQYGSVMSKDDKQRVAEALN